MAIKAARTTMDIRTVEVKGQPIRVGIKPGNGRGTPLLVFNGVGANLELLQPFVEQLRDIEVITFDVPGVGESPTPTLPYRFWNLASLVRKLIDELGYGVIDVLGVSWGGGAAQQFALQYPRHCRKLVLAATCAGMFMMPGKLSMITKMGNPRRYKDATYMAELGPKLYGGDFEDQPELLREHIGRIKMASGLGYYYQMLAAFGWTSILWLHLLRQSTLVLAGSRDNLIPLINAKLLAWRIPNSILQTIDDGHLFLVSRPAESATLVRRFLAGEGAALMPIAIAIIKDEHRALAAVLNGLGYLVGEIRAGRLQPDFELLQAMLRYIETFPDKMHHPKEDQYLVKLLKKQEAAAAVAAKMEAEHARGRDLTRDLNEALGRYQVAGAAGLEAFAGELEAYTRFHREHMRKEEEIVLPLAERALTAAEWQAIDAAFQSNTDPIVGVDTQDEFRELFSRIVKLAPAPIGVAKPAD